jgi:2-octaprenylphenol hydroxylase
MSAMSPAVDCEVAIVGAGQAGAALAALLCRHAGLSAARIALLAPDAAGFNVEPAADAEPEPRVVALSRASQRVLTNAGAWERLPLARLCAYERMRVWHASLPADGLATLAFDAAEIGEAALGVIVENAAVTRACLQSFRAAGGQPVETALSEFSVGADAVSLRLADGTMLRSRLIVGADGADSIVRERLGIGLQRHSYGQRAIVATVATTHPHRHTAWQRFLPSGPVALLPLFNGCCSIVWSADDALARELLALPAPQFAQRLEVAVDGVLGAVELRSERLSFPLQRATARQLTAARGALIGDAAHRIHPLAGQGINLGFLDAASLCESIAAALAMREDPGSPRSLRRYEQQRLTHDTLMSLSMSAFNTLFSRQGAAGWIGSRLLAVAGSNGLARRALARRAIGLDGEVPALAR